jgi:hypothetical protein
MSDAETRLRESLGPSMLHHLEMLLAEKAEEKSRARADALEEAKRANADAWTHLAEGGAVGTEYGAGLSDLLHEAHSRIRALITTPAPASIPVERVREVARSLIVDPGSDDDYERGIERGIREMMGRLGVPLDAATEHDYSACPDWCQRQPGHPGQHSVTP